MAKASGQPQNKKYVTMAAIPAYNEQEFVARVIGQARVFVNHVIVVDDGSTDNTAMAAVTAGARVVYHSHNQGYGASIRSCFEAARQNNIDALVIIDGDAQHDPADIPRLLAPIFKRKADVVIGSRFLGRKSNMPRYRAAGIRIINFLCNLGYREKLSDTQCGFRAFNKSVLNAITITETGMGASVEALIKIKERGFTIKEVPVSCRYHPASSTLNPAVHGLGVVLTILKVRGQVVLRRLTGRLFPRPASDYEERRRGMTD
jgi:glycosyltransferase involved in cell wall biosynthesis